MRYKENSGLFSPTNFTVQLQGQAQPCTFAQGCEAEGAALSGGAVLARDHQNYTGTGFVTGYEHAGAATSWAVGGVLTAESAILAIRYANATAGNGQARARTLSLYVNGSKTGQITFPTTTNWDTWSTVQQAIHLKSGMDTVALVCDPGDGCNVNLDLSLSRMAVAPIQQSSPLWSFLIGAKLRRPLVHSHRPVRLRMRA